MKKVIGLLMVLAILPMVGCKKEPQTTKILGSRTVTPAAPSTNPAAASTPLAPTNAVATMVTTSESVPPTVKYIPGSVGNITNHSGQVVVVMGANTGGINFGGSSPKQPIWPETFVADWNEELISPDQRIAVGETVKITKVLPPGKKVHYVISVEGLDIIPFLSPNVKSTEYRYACHLKNKYWVDGSSYRGKDGICDGLGFENDRDTQIEITFEVTRTKSH